MLFIISTLCYTIIVILHKASVTNLYPHKAKIFFVILIVIGEQLEAKNIYSLISGFS